MHIKSPMVSLYLANQQLDFAKALSRAVPSVLADRNNPCSYPRRSHRRL